jgi:hypothetical protein
MLIETSVFFMLAGRYDKPMPKLTLFPNQRSMNLATELVFVNNFGAQESILGIDFASLCSPAGQYDK